MRKPPPIKLAKGYQVLITNPTAWCDMGNSWQTLTNSWGYNYSIKGFAINKAKNFIKTWGGVDSFSCVVEVSNGEIVWQSWDN